MNRYTYNPQIAKLREEIAEKVRGVMKQRAESVGEFVEKYHEELGLSKSSFTQYIASVRVGKMMGATTNVSKGFGYSNKELSRLSKLLKILGISKEETPIREIMGHYSN